MQDGIFIMKWSPGFDFYLLLNHIICVSHWEKISYIINYVTSLIGQDLGWPCDLRQQIENTPILSLNK